ncbi:hypothetical protein ABMA28_014694 [Loxostege sticticalis]|uniref:Uncharacterized protein n=1 Tax=Loxostege sticticalis TaxID=481309 RepID=A0ABD0TBY7_LOXSC
MWVCLFYKSSKRNVLQMLLNRLRTRNEINQEAEYESETTNSQISKWFHTIKDIGNFVKRVGISFETTQVITGHGYHKSYLHRFKIVDDPLCPCDDTSVQDITHLTQKCPVFANVRFEHETICNNLNVNPYDINELLLKETPIESFINLIKTICVYQTDKTKLYDN